MAVETAVERAIFLSTNDFGVSATYTPVGGQASTISGIFDNDYIEVDTGGNVGFAVLQPRFLCQTSSVSTATENATLVISSTTYKVKIVKPDGVGMTELILEKQ